ncbi:hypothetical protein [Flavobacterium humi]|nr:hypothetical protein [Flavobacterium humi]
MNDENRPQESGEAPKPHIYYAIGRTIIVKGSVSKRQRPPAIPPKNKDKN